MQQYPWYPLVIPRIIEQVSKVGVDCLIISGSQFHQSKKGLKIARLPKALCIPKRLVAKHSSIELFSYLVSTKHFSHSHFLQPPGHLSASDAGDVVLASRAPDGDRDPTAGDSQSTTITSLLAEVAQCHYLFLGRGV